MKVHLIVLSMCLLAVSLGGCEGRQAVESERPTVLIRETPTVSNPSGLFVDTNLTRDLPAEPHISRFRFVKVDLEQLLNESGTPRNIKEVVFNLFPDVVYTGVIEQVEQIGDSVSWSGYFQGVEYSYFTMVYTSGVFMGHFGSPMGVYETVIVEGDLYRVIQIDQSKFPGGEG